MDVSVFFSAWGGEGGVQVPGGGGGLLKSEEGGRFPGGGGCLRRIGEI